MKKEATFEENMKKLGEIVTELEKGEIPLEKAVELYGEGIKLSAQCKTQLADAQLKITEKSAENSSDGGME
ncbi:MAG: exodeoxyribonuclease VII small subunit [Ruminococcus sp.]|nr:exodeoxyribonuclease VII small subunit [Ruminococcus sp.]